MCNSGTNIWNARVWEYNKDNNKDKYMMHFM